MHKNKSRKPVRKKTPACDVTFPATPPRRGKWRAKTIPPHQIHCIFQESVLKQVDLIIFKQIFSVTRVRGIYQACSSAEKYLLYPSV